MKRGLFIAAVLVGLVGLSLPWLRAQQAGEVRDGVFIHLSHGAAEPHRVTMALRMAELMSEDKDVLVYFDIKGIEVVLKDAADVQYKEFPAAKAQLARLAERKVTLMACPGCLKAAGKTTADLAPSIQVADKKAFFNFTKGRILTLDY
jgi:predicted peroxiredoxin